MNWGTPNNELFTTINEMKCLPIDSLGYAVCLGRDSPPAAIADLYGEPEVCYMHKNVHLSFPLIPNRWEQIVLL